MVEQNAANDEYESFIIIGSNKMDKMMINTSMNYIRKYTKFPTFAGYNINKRISSKYNEWSIILWLDII